MARDYVDPDDFPPVNEDGEFIPQEDEQTHWPDAPDAAAYHGVLGDITRELAPQTEADPIGIMGTLMVQFGVACGDGAGVHKGDLHRAKKQVVLVGDTSKARKGTSWGVASEVMRAAYPNIDSLVWTGLGSGEGIAGKLERNQKQADSGQEPEYRGLIYEGEFARLLTAMSREGNTLSHQLRNAWDNVPVGRMLSRDQSVVPRHHIGMVAHITTAELARTMRTVDTTSGFADRMQFLCVRRTQVLPNPGVPTEIVSHLIPRLRKAIEAGSKVRWLRMDEAAAVHWDEYYRAEAETTRFGLAGAVTARHEAHVVRLALIYAMADAVDHIGVEHLRAAIAFAEYALRSAVYIFGVSTGHRHADALWRLLREEPHNEVGRTDASTALGIKTAALMDEAIEVLTRLGIAQTGIHKRTDGRGGRARQVIRLTPTKDSKHSKPQGGLRPNDDQTTTPPMSGNGVFEQVHEPLQGPPGVWGDWSASYGNSGSRDPAPAMVDEESEAEAIAGQLGLIHD